MFSCIVRQSDPDDQADAECLGVRLFHPESKPGLPDLRVAPAELRERSIDVVIGHDRFTGREAAFQASQNFAGSVFAWVVHTSPDELEFMKG